MAHTAEVKEEVLHQLLPSARLCSSTQRQQCGSSTPARPQNYIPPGGLRQPGFPAILNSALKKRNQS